MPDARFRLGRLSKVIIVAAVLIVAVALAGAYVPLPYVIYRPGPTIDVLGAGDIDIQGHETYRDGGELRMVTVSVTTRDAKLGLWDVLDGLVDKDAHVYKRSLLYPDDSESTQSDDEEEGKLQMETSQSSAEVVALQALGYQLTGSAGVLEVNADGPSAGSLQADDVILSVNGTAVASTDEAVKLVQAAPLGAALTLGIRRDGQEQQVSVTPGERDGVPYLGVVLTTHYDFPFQVDVDLGQSIGGPSAGLMFSLGIYDLLTPGSLTGGATVAGTGTIADDGSVGPIGGIPQKIAAARDAGAKLFLVPADNCAEALTAHAGGVELVRVDSFTSALASIQQWVADPQAELPSCSTAS